MTKTNFRSYRILSGLLISTALLFVSTPLFAQDRVQTEKSDLVIPPFQFSAERTLQHPLKTKRTLFTDVEISLARRNISKYPEAKAIKDKVERAAEPWLEWADEDLRKLMPDARVPRAFDLNVKGCPVHGDTIFKKGRYSWIIDPKKPLQVTCPVGAETYPTNDYATYYHSNFKEKKDWDTKYVDDGWGWIGPDGERYWFVAYSNHWMWYKINDAISNLSQTYLLTGDKRYAHKATVMLYRLAEIYPSMDHAKQSRYGLMSAAAGRVYNGKIVNSIWETGLSRQLVIAYDMIWNSIDSDAELQKLHGKNGPEIRSFIEANLLEDIMDAYFERKISGNFGMHQNTLLHTVIVRQNVDREKYLRMLIDEPNKSGAHSGIRYALYNSVFRDGLPLESPHYNALWINAISTIAELLNKGGLSLYEEPRLRMIYDAQINSVAVKNFTPAIGDSGSPLGEIIGKGNAYKIAHNAYNEPRYLSWSSGGGAQRASTFSDFNSLFVSPVERKPQTPVITTAQPSRLFAGYGLGILNNKADNSGVSLTYGYHGSHYHWDFLNFELYANGQKMMPDLGYPDQMNAYVPGIYSWSQNTISHNTVVVDAQKQAQNKPGVLHNFANAPFARSVDASSQAYPQATVYRRNLVMVDVDENNSYTVDFFRVNGGKQHDYSLHGPPGEATTQNNGTWSAKQPGTLAGSGVDVGQMYDNKTMRVKGFSGGYSSYRGSGFQHLFNVQNLEKGKGVVEYRHVLDKTAQLRIHLLPVDQQKVFIADAYDLPVKKSHTIKYVVARRESTNSEPLKSTFVSLLEPYSSTAYVKDAKLLALNFGSGMAVEVSRSDLKDLIISDTTNSTKKILSYDVETDASNAVLTFGEDGALKRVFFSGGTFLRHKNQKFMAKAIKGTVISVSPAQQKLSVQLDNDIILKAAPGIGEIAHFSNAFRTTVHPIEEISLNGRQLDLKTADALLVGKFRTTEVASTSIKTDTNLPFSPLYNGVTLLDQDLNKIALVKNVEKGEILLSASPAKALKADEDLWLSNLGVGDRMEIKSSFSWTKSK